MLLVASFVRAARLLLLLALLPGPAAATAMAPAVEVGGRRLELVSCGVREVLWVDIYSAGLYLRPGAAPDAATDPDEPAALRIVVHSPMHFPYRLPEKWRRALREGLDEAAMEQVLRAYQALGESDRLSAQYQPGSGVTLYRNDQRIVSAGGHRLIAALLEAWADGAPVADKVRRVALEHRCGD